MERWAPRLIELDARAHFNMTVNSSRVHEPLTAAQNATAALIAKLQVQKVQTLRTTHLVIGAFSLAVALLTVHRIISDARKAAAMQVPPVKSRLGFLHTIHPAEIFPLVLACGAVIQQIIFVVVQATSLNTVVKKECKGLAMVTFPALFLVGYITLVFGIEMALRAFRHRRFSPRGKWNLAWCMGIISFLLLLTWLPTIIWPTFRPCVGSLIWFPGRYALFGVIILSILVFCFLLLAALIGFQLRRTADVDANERIAASRMCYFLLMAAFVYVLILPVEIQTFRWDFKHTNATSRIAEVSLFATGLFIGIFHLFLRANALRMVINPIKDSSHPASSGHKPKRPRIRFFGPSDLEMNISGPLGLQRGFRPDSRQGLIDVGPEKNRDYDFDSGYFIRHEKPLSPGSMKSFDPVDLTKWPLPPEPAEMDVERGEEPTTPGQSHKRTKSAYSLFPTRAEDIPRLPATVYSPGPKSKSENRTSKLAMRRQRRTSSHYAETTKSVRSVTDINEAFSFLSKPPPLFGGGRHGRQQSCDSSATVQIGLRFSVAPATLAAAKCTAINRQVDGRVPALRRDNSESSGASLGLPIQAPSLISSHSHSNSSASSAHLSSLNFPAPPQRGAEMAKGAEKTTGASALLVLGSAKYVGSQRGKVLPPTPRSDGVVSGALVPRHSQANPHSQAQARSQAHSHLHPGLSGLRMNPVSPASPHKTVASPRTPRSVRIAGTMTSSPPRDGWI